MAEQWRWSGGMEPRRVGLDFGALNVVLEMVGARKKERQKILCDMPAMQQAALDVWLQESKRRQASR